MEIANFFNHSSPCQNEAIVGFLLVFVVVNYFSYVGVSRFLIVSEAALLNLSTLTGDLYAVLFSIFGEHIIPQPLFFVAMIVIVAGVLIYESGPSPIAPKIEADETSLTSASFEEPGHLEIS